MFWTCFPHALWDLSVFRTYFPHALGDLRAGTGRYFCRRALRHSTVASLTAKPKHFWNFRKNLPRDASLSVQWAPKWGPLKPLATILSTMYSWVSEVVSGAYATERYRENFLYRGRNSRGAKRSADRKRNFRWPQMSTCANLRLEATPRNIKQRNSTQRNAT